MDDETRALMRALNESFEEYAKLNEKMGKDLVSTVAAIDDPVRLGDTMAAHLIMKVKDKQEVLETEDLTLRLEMLFDKVRNEINILKLETRLKKRVKKQMEKTQKDYYLNEQMRAIQKEMGTKDDFKAELAELEKKIKRKRLSKEAHARVWQEFKKLKMMSPMSAEATVVRNYIDWILALPWAEKTKTGWICRRRRRSWTRTTMVSRNPRRGSWSTWRSRVSPRRSRARSSAWWGLRAWARPRWPSPWPGPRDAIS